MVSQRPADPGRGDAGQDPDRLVDAVGRQPDLGHERDEYGEVQQQRPPPPEPRTQRSVPAQPADLRLPPLPQPAAHPCPHVTIHVSPLDSLGVRLPDHLGP